ncbi:PP2C family protein-serine/threonine phosphatase [Paraburkholderia tagetis]|uniref:Protein phosphatase 2C domain-containing protein n=1 Tax=Paraburkholderia tagetis TaxID=2913261 RepID=A0A9X1UK80_9BURK|nr:protein phosphatase 2C domain-containing protein [Paraburkholderia tagetis]MCG5072731.1 protein phosphatase 2C domain-containing protein [Paraburkholderia tagetis]
MWTSASRTDVGRVRALNEDACLDLPAQGLWAVADGMGGHTAGDLASQTIVRALGALGAPGALSALGAPAASNSLAAIKSAACSALQTVNQQLREEAARRRVRVIGSTVAVLMASGRECGWLWAGDSRLYLYRDARLEPLTTDHSHVAELQAQGHLSAEAARHHPSQHLITRAVGAANWLDLDEGHLAVRDGDCFLLCSDGLSNEVQAAEMARALEGGDCQLATDTLVDMALQAGGRDNITAIVIRVEDLDAADHTLVNPAVVSP